MTYDVTMVNRLDECIDRVQDEETTQLLTIYHVDDTTNEKIAGLFIYFGENDEIMLEAIDVLKRKAKRSQHNGDKN